MTDQATPTPSSPSEPPVSTPEGGASPSSFDWGSMADGLEGPAPATDSSPDSPPPEPQPIEQPPALAAPPPAPAVAPQAIPPQTPPQAAPQATPPTLEQPAAEQPAEMLDPKWVEAGLASLTQGYNLTREQAQAFEEDPTGTLPALAARVHMNVLQQSAAMMHHVLQNIVPRLVADRLTAYKNETRLQSTMETRVLPHWPRLSEVPPDVQRMAATLLKSRIPSASFEEARDAFGKMIYGMYGWDLPNPGAPPAAAPPAVNRPQMQPQPSAPASPPPYAPVMPGGMTPPPAALNSQSHPANPFLDLLDPR